MLLDILYVNSCFKKIFRYPSHLIRNRELGWKYSHKTSRIYKLKLYYLLIDMNAIRHKKLHKVIPCQRAGFHCIEQTPNASNCLPSCWTCYKQALVKCSHVYHPPVGGMPGSSWMADFSAGNTVYFWVHRKIGINVHIPSAPFARINCILEFLRPTDLLCEALLGISSCDYFLYNSPQVRKFGTSS